MFRLTKILALGAVTASLLAVSAGSALAGSRHSSTPPQGTAVSAVQTEQGLSLSSDTRHSS